MIQVDGETITARILADTMIRMLEARRDALIRDLAGVEEALGYGGPGRKPTTAQLRKRYRRERERRPEYEVGDSKEEKEKCNQRKS